MLNAKESSIQTRQNTGFLAIGQGISNFPSSKHLPLTGDVMKYTLYRKNLPEFKHKAPDQAFCCPLQHGTLFASCCELNGCCCIDPSSIQNKCVVAKVKYDGVWLKSGLPFISDYSIKKKVLKIFDEYKALCKHKSRSTAKEKQKKMLLRWKWIVCLTFRFQILLKN